VVAEVVVPEALRQPDHGLAGVTHLALSVTRVELAAVGPGEHPRRRPVARCCASTSSSVSATGTTVRRIGVFNSSAGLCTVGRISRARNRECDLLHAQPARLAGREGARPLLLRPQCPPPRRPLLLPVVQHVRRAPRGPLALAV
jgi:hypothetical protein